MGTMLDTVDDPGGTFSGLDVEAVAAYGNGRFANFKAAKKEFPKTHVLEIDVNGQGIGNAGDFEAGDMAFSHAGAWAKERLEAGVHKPVIYFSASNWQAVMNSLQAAGVSRKDVRIWTAHYTGRAHLCSPACKNLGITGRADATQWGSTQASGTLPSPYAGRNVDVSKTAPKFFAGASMSPSPRSTAKKRPAAVEAGKAVNRQLTLTTPITKGPDVRALQEAIEGGLKHYKVDWLPLEIDGEFGPQTVHAAALYGWILGIEDGTRRKLTKNGTLPEAIQEILRNPEKRGAPYRERSDERKEQLKELRKAHKQGPQAAVAYAKAMIGVTEDPPESNTGPAVTRKGKKGGISFWEKAFGQGACFWCLCFACYCVRDVGGAKVGGVMINAAEVERMAKARIEGWVEVPKSQAKAGDIALYAFEQPGKPDHGELVVGPLKNGMFNDVGGNTSSDDGGSQSNGGGVFAKLRDPDLLTCVARPLY
jgi:hypothetical protein